MRRIAAVSPQAVRGCGWLPAASQPSRAALFSPLCFCCLARWMQTAAAARSLSPRSWRFSSASPAPSRVLLSTDVKTRCVRNPCDPSLPPPPPFPLLPPPTFPSWQQRTVDDTLFTPAVLCPWPIIASGVQSPVIVDQCNLLLALAHRLSHDRPRRRFKAEALAVYRLQRKERRPHVLAALWQRVRTATERCIRCNALTPLPGWRPAEVQAVMQARGGREGRRSCSFMHRLELQRDVDDGRIRIFAEGRRLPRRPIFTRHQLKIVAVIERWQERQRQQRLREREELSRGVRKALTERLKREAQEARQRLRPPNLWKQPGHVEWLMRQRRKERERRAREGSGGDTDGSQAEADLRLWRQDGLRRWLW